MADKINPSSFFNQEDDGTASSALNLAQQSFSISQNIQSQLGDLIKSFSSFKVEYEEGSHIVNNTIQENHTSITNIFNESLTDIHKTFGEIDQENVKRDTTINEWGNSITQQFTQLSSSVKVVSDDVLKVSKLFVDIQSKQQANIESQADAAHAAQDAAQKGRTKSGGPIGSGGLGGGGGSLTEDFGGVGGKGKGFGLLGGLGMLGAGAFGLADYVSGGIRDAVSNTIGGIKDIGGNVIGGVKNFFGGLFGGGDKDKKSPVVSSNFLGGPLPDVKSPEGKVEGKGKGLFGGLFGGGEKKEEKSKLQKLTDAGYKFDDQGVNAMNQRVINYTGPEHGQKFRKGLMGTLGIGNMGQYEKRQTGSKMISGIGRHKGHDSLEDIVARDKDLQVPKRGIGNRLLGGIDAATGNITDFDQKGGETFGSGRALGGFVDAATGGLTDMDKKGGKPFGLMRGLTGTVDFLTGNKFDLDKRGDGVKPVKGRGDEVTKQLTEPPSDAVTMPEVLDAIEMSGSNTSEQPQISVEETDTGDFSNDTTPPEGTSCVIDCINKSKQNSVYNLLTLD